MEGFLRLEDVIIDCEGQDGGEMDPNEVCWKGLRREDDKNLHLPRTGRGYLILTEKEVEKGCTK